MNFLIRNFRWCRATKSSGSLKRSVPMPIRLFLEAALVCRGLGSPAASAPIAGPAWRTSATRRSSRALREMAGLPLTLSLINDFPSSLGPRLTQSLLPRFSVLGLLAGGR
ncbi:hypothetical protein D9M70_549090 [compost metagenome]